ncbi:alpha/beta fold hydrolase [Streptomyces pharetrae]|uniref:alpha/beta fold hydrolase n=1 Tax=Streptomyces pharetrae TaxID=291370 RepID=UPI00334D7154
MSRTESGSSQAGLASRSTADPGPPPVLVPLARRAGSTRSVLFHPLGGGLGPYAGLIAHLARRGPVYGIRALGTHPGEEPDTTITGMADRYAALLGQLPQQPTLLVGWSLGGLLAWETAVRLTRERSADLPDLVLIDSSPRPWPSRDAHQHVRQEILRRSAEQLGEDMLAPLARVVDAHAAARADYTVTCPYPGRVLQVTCTHGDDPDQGDAWAALSDAPTRRTLPCGHFDALGAPHLRTLTGFIRDFLATAAR